MALVVKRTPTQDGVVVELTGNLDQHADLAGALQNVKGTLELKLQGVASVSSAGVVAWLATLRRLKAAGVTIIFSECSPSILEQLHLVRSFLSFGEVRSVCLSYFCRPCNVDQLVTVAVQRGAAKTASRPICARCGHPMELVQGPLALP